MAIQSPYKKYKRGQRQADIETDFTKGMMYSEGNVSEGYVKTLVNFDFTQDGRNALKPRAALVTSEVIVPDMTPWDDPLDELEFLDSDTVLKYSKECVENGIDYRQFIFGKPDVLNGEALNSGEIWLATSKKDINDFEEVVTASYDLAPASSDAAFYTTGLTEIHDVQLEHDAKTAFPVGTFLGNSFYFFESAGNHGTLKRTVFDDTVVPLVYKFESVTPKAVSASEAVSYGFNVLSSNPYSFLDKSGGSSIFEMEGILPYDNEFKTGNNPQLIMTPKANTRVWFRCNYNIPTESGAKWKIVWSWKEVDGNDNWTVFHTKTNLALTTPLTVVQADLVVPAKEIMIRCEAYKTAGSNNDPTVVEKAMTVGFNFKQDAQSTILNTEPIAYDLSTATGMISWRNRLVCWGLPEDPTILFISDLDEPTYFPYPNNVTVFDEPVIAAVELMDNLVVFTKSKVHQVSLNEDGYTWTDTVIQSNLYIEPWDKHLIQSIRNMVYFKSGNYYYMIVPKAQSTTGELTLAPITTPITDFFNHFQSNVDRIFKDCYKTIIDGELVQRIPEKMVTYYNFVDYESVHNFYVYRYEDVYVHFDIIYNVVSRYWKINVYESVHFLFPFRNDATQTGLMSGTSIQPIRNMSYNGSGDESGESGVESGDESGGGGSQILYKRIVQLFKFNPLYVEDLYIPADVELEYYPTHEEATVSDHTVTIPGDKSRYDAEDENLYLPVSYIRPHLLSEEWLYFIGSNEWVGGFYKSMLRDAVLVYAADELRDTSIFPNRQMLDTGYRDATPFINKRYRELQLQINNLENVDMEFGMDFQIAGEPRNTDFLYEVSQVIDEIRQDEGIIYLDATPYLPIDSDRIDKINMWTIEHQPAEDDIMVSLWKVRAAISGKGVAPRMRLFTRGAFNYQLLGINWIYREMNMR